MTNFDKKLAKPYRKLPSSLSARRKVDAYESLLDKVGAIESYKDYFAGIGLAAGVVLQKLSPRLTVLQDIDEDCRKTLRREFPTAEIRNVDFFKDEDERHYDLVALDFNVMTLLHFRRNEELKRRVRGILAKSSSLVLTDSARSKFHLNRRSYGVESLTQYWKSLADELGARLVTFEDKIEVSYGLLTPGD